MLMVVMGKDDAELLWRWSLQGRWDDLKKIGKVLRAGVPESETRLWFTLSLSLTKVAQGNNQGRC